MIVAASSTLSFLAKRAANLTPSGLPRNAGRKGWPVPATFEFGEA